MNLQVNQVLERETGTDQKTVDRILYVDPLGERLAAIDVFDPRACPVWHAVAEWQQALASGARWVLAQDPRRRFPGLEEALPENHRAYRDRAWTILQDLVLDEHGQPRVAVLEREQRGPLVAAAAQAHRVTGQTVYRYLRQYWQCGQTKNALLPGYGRCGGPGRPHHGKAKKLGRPSARDQVTGQATGVVIDEEIEKRFRRGIKVFYETPQRLPLTKAFQRTLEAYFHSGYEWRQGSWAPILLPPEERPTFRQFQYWYAHHGGQYSEQAVKARLTERRFNLSYRPMTGEATPMAFGPGSIFQIDATVADVYLVSALDPGRIIGRPVLYVVVDAFSRLVAGFSVSLEGPSWLGAMLALENATTDKVAFCAEYGIAIRAEDWPVHDLPKEILADRGEMEGFNADQVVNGLGVRISNTAPYRADWKPIVERSFRLINDQLIHWVPGAVYLPHERGGQDYRLEACLTLFQFRSLLIHLFLFHNHFCELKEYRRDEAMLHDQVEPYPLELWNWGIQNRAGQLRCMDAELIRLNLLPEAEASVTEKGLIFKQRRYDCARAQAEQWYGRARLNGRWKIKVAYDPRRLDTLYLRLGNDQLLEPCTLRPDESAFQGRDWYEILDHAELERQKEPARRAQQQQAEAELEAQIAAVVDPAREAALAERRGQSKSSVVNGIRENRAQERERERQSGAWQLASPAADAASGSREAEPPQPGYVPPPRHIALLRALDKERLSHD
jgi:Mu transposase-like protein